MSAAGPGSPRAGQPRGAANEDGLLALGRRHRAASDGRLRGGARVAGGGDGSTWSLVGVGALVLAIVLAGVAIYIYLGTLVSHVKVNSLQTTGKTENILLVGSTTRCAPGEKDSPQTGFCSQATGVNSDIVMVVHLNPNTHTAALLSIPRDLFEPNARAQAQANKIDAALYQGPSQLATAVEEDFGIPINHFIELNFTTFANVVNAIGGVDMYFPKRVFDAYSSLQIERPGCYHLDGIHALEVVRARHLQIQYSAADGTNPRAWPYEPLSDLARIRRTHEFLRVVAGKVASMGIGNPSTDLEPRHHAPPGPHRRPVLQRRRDGVARRDVPQHADLLGPPAHVPVVVDLSPNGYTYKGGPYGDVEFPVQPGGWQTVDSILGVGLDFSPWNGQPLPPPGAFHISVVDGSVIPNQQTTVAAAADPQGVPRHLDGRPPAGRHDGRDGRLVRRATAAGERGLAQREPRGGPPRDDRDPRAPSRSATTRRWSPRATW